MAPTILREDERAVWFLLDRPDKRNALSPAVSAALDEALTTHHRTPKPFVVASAVPGMFVSGTDIAALKERTVEDSLGRLNSDLFQRLEEHPWPTVAVVDGYALGGGCELALACDLRVTTPRAKWGLPEVRLGLVPSGGGLWRLPRLVGWDVATDLILTGRRIDGEEAHRLRLASRLAEPEGLDQAVDDLLGELTAPAPGAQRLAKEAMRVAPDHRRRVDALAQAVCIGGEEAQDRLAAFLSR